ncbi:MAG: DNA translocase FtsK [Chlamydiae bacterium]|nr:DNA translocase FtsK [Chlamydiota bacterium]
MAKTTTPQSPSHPEAKGLLLLAGSLLLSLSLVSFDKHLPSANWLGLIGHGLAFALSFTFGLCSFFLLGFLFWYGWKLLAEGQAPLIRRKVLYFSLFLFSLSLLLNVASQAGFPFPDTLLKKVYSQSIFFEQPYPHLYTRHSVGGVFTYFLYQDIPQLNLEKLLSNVGIVITFSTILLTSLFLCAEGKIVPWTRFILRKYEEWKKAKLVELRAVPTQQMVSSPLYPPAAKQAPLLPRKSASLQEQKPTTPLYEEEILPVELVVKEATVKTSMKTPKTVSRSSAGYQLPSPSLLVHPVKIDQPSLKRELKRQAEILEETLMSFGIEAKVGEINSGPTITSFEVHPAIGVKVQKITALESDIALNLQAKSIRIIAPIPGKAAVGVEIPSLFPQAVNFKEMLVHYQQQNKKHHIPVLLGKTVNGEHLVSDLAKMPHCIIAGATGSGKSVCINTLVMSIVMNATPDEIRLLLVDPKKVELTGYTHLPHLLAPVITEPHGAYAALNWLVKEMTARYEILRQLGLRNIHAFNNRTQNRDLEASLSIQVPERMFSIVAIIDEFADLMMVSSSDLETPIARIAQMARAVGIHLVLATQRPSREVITGLIKANFPTRIAFKVASRVNSQIILDDNGAESLLGNGDMLFLPPGSSQLIRAQGAFISDEEINRVISFITSQAPPNYLIASFDTMRKEDIEFGSEDEEPRDSLYEQALTLVVQTKTASTTFLQRKLKIGYARAASLMDELEKKGVIGQQEGSRPRRVLLSRGSEGEALLEDLMDE